jgi:hypothetical protein
MPSGRVVSHTGHIAAVQYPHKALQDVSFLVSLEVPIVDAAPPGPSHPERPLSPPLSA